MSRPVIDKGISLNEVTHVYTLAGDPDFKFVSGTTFIKKFFRPFDAKKIATNLVKTHWKYRSYTIKQLMDEWTESALRGTRIHKEIEDYLLFKKQVKSKAAEHGIKVLNRIPTGMNIHTEVILYSKELGVSGTADILVENPLTGKWSILDWKTNSKIDRTSFKNQKGIRSATSHLPDCKFTIYTLQLSLYAYMLEEYYGIEIEKLYLAHITDDKHEVIACEYMKDVIIEMLKDK